MTSLRRDCWSKGFSQVREPALMVSGGKALPGEEQQMQMSWGRRRLACLRSSKERVRAKGGKERSNEAGRWGQGHRDAAGKEVEGVAMYCSSAWGLQRESCATIFIWRSRLSEAKTSNTWDLSLIKIYKCRPSFAIFQFHQIGERPLNYILWLLHIDN